MGHPFAPAQAGRALSAFNLVIFCGVFFVQWGMGLLVDAFTGLGWAPLQTFRATFAVFGLCGVLSYGWFLRPQPAAADNPG